MKKVLFTALMVVAFNAAANAKNVEVKNTLLKTEVVQQQEQACEQRAIDVYESIIGGGADNISLLNALIGLCH
ncbi:hypothetical protein [Flavobacterium sp. LC2016-12]|uniref:hypothetical protein n=1 Tax=Flavobacterium sp. LC2016-12 TaxID=2783794 RepID=UPI00188BA15E|nr:hypothetical protein [Flavobacterium sp. LC2016-12]MBF4466837.1 hypothetical protein [Flavobacterium sp. LC2016-12]